jgi:hypothetical protein
VKSTLHKLSFPSTDPRAVLDFTDILVVEFCPGRCSRASGRAVWHTRSRSSGSCPWQRARSGSGLWGSRQRPEVSRHGSESCFCWKTRKWSGDSFIP